MEEKYKEYEKTIKRKHRFGWTPKFKDEFRTNLSKSLFTNLALKAFEVLDWEINYLSQEVVEACRKSKFGKLTEKISVQIDASGKVIVQSESLTGESLDWGRNSKRVGLFIYAFREIEKSYDKQALTTLEEEIKREENWDDYQIPDLLPLPELRKPPQIVFPVVIGFVSSLILGFVLAFLTIKVIYIIGIYEGVVAFALAFIFKYAIRFGNFTDFNKIRKILMVTIFLIYFSNLYFQYLMILTINDLPDIGFFKFIEIRLQQGLTLKKMNTGWIGMVLSWIFQLGFTYFLSLNFVPRNIIDYQLERVPEEVRDFILYHFAKDKTEEQIRMELSKMGWKTEQVQNEALESVYAIYATNEIRRY